MNEIFNWLKLALPFLELAYNGALFINPGVAAEIRTAIDALKRAVDVPATGAIAARGYQEIDAFGQNVMASLTQLKESDVSDAEKVKQADDLVRSLSDPTKVYQAQHGKDAQLLQSYKSQAQAAAGAILG